LRRPATLTAWAAVAVANTIDQLTGKQASLKWPNDVYVNSRKVCGVLIEHRRVTVAGIGLNLNQNEDEFKANGLPLAGSLAMVAGKRFDAVDVTRMLLAEFDQMYDGMVRDSSLLESNWRERLSMMDRHVVAESFDGTRHRGVLRVCSFEKLTFEHADGSTIELPPEQVRALSSPLAA
jgi:BirA family biotin operon repressor/biotin-[acetyl-CoA-carboxylase] ligase